jgi:hypothetical protein
LWEQFQLGGSLQLIMFGLLIFDSLAAIALAAVITRPYIRDVLFNWEIVDEGWIRCIPSHGGELDSDHVPIGYYPPDHMVSVSVYEKPSQKSV